MIRVFLKNKEACRDVDARRFELATPPFLVVETIDQAMLLLQRSDVENIEQMAPWPLARKEANESTRPVALGSLTVGGPSSVVIAGPCAVESASQIHRAAKVIKAAGAHGFRGGAYKPRTSPYAFQGHETQGAEWLAAAAREVLMPSVSEIVDAADIESLLPLVDVFQVGARSMQNYALLKALGKAGKPVVLKRGFGNTVQEFLSSAEYLLAHGNPHVVLCERGIRTFEGTCRFMLDLNAIAWLKEHTHLPVIVDPSHAAGQRASVAPLARAALAAGADGLLIEVHPEPSAALSDKAQALSPRDFEELMSQLQALAEALGRPLQSPASHVGATPPERAPSPPLIPSEHDVTV